MLNIDQYWKKIALMLPHSTAESNCIGMTLIELLVSLSLLAILLFFSLPFAPSLYNKNQLQVVTDEVSSAIHFAKIQALLTGDVLVLSPLSGGRNDWSHGMLLFVDNPKHQYMSDDKLLHEWHWNSNVVRVFWHGFQSDEYVLFAADISHSTTNGYFIIKNDTKQLKLVVNRLGRVKKSKLS